jgi:Mrp family chromosome partitioning ATPase
MPHELLSPVSERLQRLRTNAEFQGVDGRLQTVMVASPGPAERESLVATNLAGAAARAGRRMVLIEADLHCARVNDLFARPQKVRLTNALLEGLLGEAWPTE